MCSTKNTFSHNIGVLGVAINNSNLIILSDESEFTNNEAQACGAITHSTKDLIIIGINTFTSNKAIYSAESDEEFSGLGGALLVESGTAILSSTNTFKNNTALLGGAIYNMGSLTLNGTTLFEMLGVLGIIGVLSVGGIVGYKYAMTEYRSDEIVNELNLRAASILIRIGSLDPLAAGETYEMGEFLFAGMSVEAISNGNDSFIFYVDDVPENIKDRLMHKVTRVQTVSLVEPDENTSETTLSSMSFEFANNMEGKNSEDDTGEVTPEEDDKCTGNGDCSAIRLNVIKQPVSVKRAPVGLNGQCILIVPAIMHVEMILFVSQLL